MKASHRRRLVEIEKKASVDTDAVPARIIILTVGDCAIRAFGENGLELHRDPGETAEDFESRVLEAIPAPRGAPSVVMFF